MHAAPPLPPIPKRIPSARATRMQEYYTWCLCRQLQPHVMLTWLLSRSYAGRFTLHLRRGHALHQLPARSITLLPPAAASCCVAVDKLTAPPAPPGARSISCLHAAASCCCFLLRSCAALDNRTAPPALPRKFSLLRLRRPDAPVLVALHQLRHDAGAAPRLPLLLPQHHLQGGGGQCLQIRVNAAGRQSGWH